jgi:hypothetical protein
LRFQNQEKFTNIWLAPTIQTVMPVGFTILLLYARNKAEKSTQRGESFKGKMSQKSSAFSILFEGGEGPLQIEFTHCRQKTTTYFVKLYLKGEREKKKKENL